MLIEKSFVDAIGSGQIKDWATIFLIAHEIGHLLHGDLITSAGNSPEREAEADEFAGAICYRFGATRDEIVQALGSVEVGRGGRVDDRVNFATRGWLRAQEESKQTK